MIVVDNFNKASNKCKNTTYYFNIEFLVIIPILTIKDTNITNIYNDNLIY